MRPSKHVDPEYASLLLDYISHGVFRPASPEAVVLTKIADQGFSALDFEETSLWYDRILPIVSKPLAEQAAVAAIVRNGGRVPSRISAQNAPLLPE